MSLKERSAAFLDAVVTKNVTKAKHSLYTIQFKRLVLKRRLLELLFSLLVIFGGQQFLFQNAFFSPIWPTAAVGLAAIFLRGNFLLVGIFLGSLISYLVNHTPFIFSLAQSVLLIIFLWLTRTICLKWIGPITPLATVKVLTRFIGIVACSSFVHIVLFFKIFSMAHLIPFSISYVLLGWIGELNAILCLVPLSLVFEPFVPQRFFHKGGWAWWTISLILIGCHFLYYFVPQGMSVFMLPVSFFIALIFYARAFGQIPTCITLFGLSVIYLGAVRSPLTLFNEQTSVTEIGIICGFLTLSAIISLGIATFIQERYYSNI